MTARAPACDCTHPRSGGSLLSSCVADHQTSRARSRMPSSASGADVSARRRASERQSLTAAAAAAARPRQGRYAAPIALRLGRRATLGAVVREGGALLAAAGRGRTRASDRDVRARADVLLRVLTRTAGSARSAAAGLDAAGFCAVGISSFRGARIGRAVEDVGRRRRVGWRSVVRRRRVLADGRRRRARNGDRERLSADDESEGARVGALGRSIRGGSRPWWDRQVKRLRRLACRRSARTSRLSGSGPS